MQLFERIFKLRTCSKFIPKEVKSDGTEDRACLNFQINKCDAPCIGNISYEEYHERIDQVILFLKGKTDAIISQLRSQMERASESQQYEKASKYRDQILEITHVTRKQIMSNQSLADVDVIGIARYGSECCSVILKIRDGKLIKKEHYFLENTQQETPALILSRFITHYYNYLEDIPPILMMQQEPEDSVLIQELLKSKIHIPQRGDKKKLVDMASIMLFYLSKKRSWFI